MCHLHKPIIFLTVYVIISFSACYKLAIMAQIVPGSQHTHICLVFWLSAAIRCFSSDCKQDSVFYPVDIGMTTSTSPASDITALCLDSWPAAIFTQILTSRLPPAITYQLTADSLL